VHDFMDKQLGKASPYGVYDLTENQGWVSVGRSRYRQVRWPDVAVVVTRDVEPGLPGSDRRAGLTSRPNS
jgi:hypothetical protein